MQTALYRIGKFAAARPWTTLGAWVLVAVVVIVSSSVGGKEFEDSFTVPGTDSDDALVLLEEAQSDQSGVSAQLVVASATPGESILGDDGVDEIAAEFAQLDDVILVTDPQISPDGEVAPMRVLYPSSTELSKATLEDFQELRAELDEASGVDSIGRYPGNGTQF